MKIRKKNIEESTFERRNTSIAVFASASLLPLIITFLLGLNLGQVETVNDRNLLKAIDQLTTEKDSLEEVIAAERRNASLLHEAFVEADSLQEHFRSEVVKRLEEQLDGAAHEVDIHRWDNDREAYIDDFKHGISRITRRREFENDFLLSGVLAFAKKWLEEYADSKDEELFARKISTKQEMGVAVSTDLDEKINSLEQNIGDLKNEMTKKDVEIIGLKKDLQQCAKDLDESHEESQQDVTLKDRKINQLEKDIQICNENAKMAKGEVANHLKNIQKELLNLEGQKFFRLKNNEKEVEQLKGRIQILLNQITTSLQEL